MTQYEAGWGQWVHSDALLGRRFVPGLLLAELFAARLIRRVHVGTLQKNAILNR